MIRFEDFQLENIATGIKASIPADVIYKFTIDDKITPNYNESTGYGKFDPIVVYKNTTRTVTVNMSLKGAIDFSFLIKNFAMITLPRYAAVPGSTTDYVSIGSTVLVSAPLYHLNLSGYFSEYGVIKDLSVKPSFESKDMAFTQPDEGLGPLSIQNNYTKRYGFTKLDISFNFIVLHKETPNTDVGKSLINWPFSDSREYSE